MRPSFEEIYMSFAEKIAERSTCKRLQVGTVITSTDYRQVYSIGYNGNASGFPNTCDRETPGDCGDLHSEINSIINLTEPRSSSKHVFVTHSPCTNCAKALVNVGNIKKVFYKNKYRVTLGLEILDQAGIETIYMGAPSETED